MKSLQQKLNESAKALEPILADVLNEIEHKTDFEIQQELEDRFDQFMDEVYPPVQIGYLTFYPSQILKECDPIAYRIALSEFEDEE